MGDIRAPIPVKLFVGMLSRDPELFNTCTARLTEAYGPVDLRSDALPWDHSDYYRREMGSDLRRVFLFFEHLIDPVDLASIKCATIQLEQELAFSDALGAHRRINLDPGYLTEAKVVLATTKDFPHRVYVGAGIYAESTLHYSKNSGAYIAVEHTYPDFRSGHCRDLFGKARDALRAGLRGR